MGEALYADASLKGGKENETMKPDEEKKIPEAPKSDETLPEGALEGVSGGGQETPQYGGLVAPPNTAPLLR